MKKRTSAVLVAAFLAMVAAVLWTPVVPGSRGTVVGLVNPTTGVREVRVASLPPSSWDRAWIWATFGNAPEPTPAYFRAKHVGQSLTLHKPTIWWGRLALELGLLLALGGLALITLTVRDRRRATE